MNSEAPIFLDFLEEKEEVLQTTEFTLEDDQDDDDAVLVDFAQNDQPN